MTMRETLDLGLTIDERLADGYYYSKSVRLLKYLLEHPEELEKEEKKTFFEQAEDAKNALEQAKTEEHAKTEGQTEIKNQAEEKLERGIDMLLEVAELKYGRQYAQSLKKKMRGGTD